MGQVSSTEADATILAVLVPFYTISITLILLLFTLLINDWLFARSLKKRLKQTYATLSTKEKDEIKKLETEIEFTLDAYAPGREKALDAWHAWSKDEKKELKKWLPRFRWRGSPATELVERSLRKAELAMRSEKQAMEMLEKRNEEAKEARLHAALMRGIYWSEEIAKARAKKAKKEDFPFNNLDSQV